MDRRKRQSALLYHKYLVLERIHLYMYMGEVCNLI